MYDESVPNGKGEQAGLLDGFLGNASEVEVSRIEGDFAQVLASGERIEKAYQLIRYLFVFTNKRLILVDKQASRETRSSTTLSYRNITHFSVETAGHLDLDAALKVWISGSPVPIQKRFNKNLNIYQVQSVLAGYVLGNQPVGTLNRALIVSWGGLCRSVA